MDVIEVGTIMECRDSLLQNVMVVDDLSAFSLVFKDDLNTWTICWEPSDLEKLTTLTVQSTICAALNSRRRLAFLIGVGRGKNVSSASIIHN